jgi:hypothetical protein
MFLEVRPEMQPCWRTQESGWRTAAGAGQQLRLSFSGPKIIWRGAVMKAIEKEGVESDLRIWTLTCTIRGYEGTFHFEVSGATKRRLWKRIQNEQLPGTTAPIVVFDTTSSRVALNLSDLQACQFDLEGRIDVPTEEEKRARTRVRIYFRGQSTPRSWTVDEDAPDADAGAPETATGQFGQIFEGLDTRTEEGERYQFIDTDGEWVFIRGSDISMLEVPLWVVDGDRAMRTKVKAPRGRTSRAVDGGVGH